VKNIKRRKLKVARVSTVPFFIDNQLRLQLKQLVEKDFEIIAVASMGDWERLLEVEGLQCKTIRIERKPAIFKDLASIYNLYKFFKKHKFDIVHSTTPKAGIVCGIAARLAGIKVCLHTFTGQTWIQKSGLSRYILKTLDKFILSMMTQAYADSHSQQQFLITEGIGNTDRVKVLGQGSLAGVDTKRFNRERNDIDTEAIKSELGIGPKDFVLSFVGRLTTDKGVNELVEAYRVLRQKYENLHLIMVGPVEGYQVFSLNNEENVHIIGKTKLPEKYLAVSDVLCLPSYREGFGTVVIEAAAMGVPTIGTDIVGLRDAIVSESTGILVKLQDLNELVQAIEKLIIDREYCKNLGMEAYKRCLSAFKADDMSELVAEEYRNLLGR
jgi:glycosyltransferase involved in cell wall biosynthesis